MLVLIAFALLAPLAVIALVPLGLVQRYRSGTARRVAHGWLAALNIGVISFSVALFLSGAALTSLWIPDALSYSLTGFASGCLLGICGLALTRWEATPDGLFYTPNRLLVLGITFVVAGRLAYGGWRLWQGWRLGGDGGGWLLQSGLPGSLAAGGVVLGYSLAYWMGVRRQTRRTMPLP